MFSFSIKFSFWAFLRKWEYHQDHRLSQWIELEINFEEANQIAHDHWDQLYRTPIRRSHHYLTHIQDRDWERIRLACIITMAEQSINAIKMLSRDVSLGRIRYRDNWYDRLGASAWGWKEWFTKQSSLDSSANQFQYCYKINSTLKTLFTTLCQGVSK